MPSDSGNILVDKINGLTFEFKNSGKDLGKFKEWGMDWRGVASLIKVVEKASKTETDLDKVLEAVSSWITNDKMPVRVNLNEEAKKSPYKILEGVLSWYDEYQGSKKKSPLKESSFNPSFDIFDKERIPELVEALENFASAAFEVNGFWASLAFDTAEGSLGDGINNILNEGYPESFNASFEDVVYQINDWVESVKEKLQDREDTNSDPWNSPGGLAEINYPETHGPITETIKADEKTQKLYEEIIQGILNELGVTGDLANKLEDSLKKEYNPFYIQRYVSAQGRNKVIKNLAKKVNEINESVSLTEALKVSPEDVDIVIERAKQLLMNGLGWPATKASEFITKEFEPSLVLWDADDVSFAESVLSQAKKSKLNEKLLKSKSHWDDPHYPSAPEDKVFNHDTKFFKNEGACPGCAGLLQDFLNEGGGTYVCPDCGEKMESKEYKESLERAFISYEKDLKTFQENQEFVETIGGDSYTRNILENYIQNPEGTE